MKHVFRRFGGTFQGNDSSNIALGVVGISGLVLLCGLALFTANVSYVVAGFAWLFIFTIASLFGERGATSDLRKELYDEYLAEAVKHFHNNAFEQAEYYFDKASRYGVMPSEYQYLRQTAIHQSNLTTPVNI